MFSNRYLFVYLIIILIIGWRSSRKQTGKGFMIANRQLDIYGFVSSIIATFIGGTAIVAYTAYSYEFGIGPLFGFFGVALGFVLFGYFGRQLRTMAHQYNFYTIADFFRFKYGNLVGDVIAGVVAVMLVVVLFVQMVAGAQILSSIAQISYELSLLLSASFVFVYLLLGGFKSVIKTDIFQYVIIILLLFVLGIIISRGVDMTFIDFVRNGSSVPDMISFLVYGSVITWFAADIWQRVYAAKDDKVVQQGFRRCAAIVVFLGICISMIGMTAKMAFPNIDPAQAIVYGITKLLPVYLVDLGVVLMFAVIMSSADTIIFTLATNIAKDVVARIRPRYAQEELLMKVTRLSIIAVVLLSFVGAYIFRDVVDLALVKGGIGMSLVPAIIGSFRGSLSKKAVIVSISGGLLWVVFWILMAKITPVTMVSSVLVAGILLILVQLLIRKKYKA